MNNRSWGYHLIINAAEGDLTQVQNKKVLYSFVKELVTAIDMIAYKEPLIEHFATHCEEAAGYSLVQLIETSAIMGHFVDINGDFYLDIFSCKPFDEAIAQEIIRKHFNPKAMDSQFIERQAPMLVK